MSVIYYTQVNKCYYYIYDNDTNNDVYCSYVLNPRFKAFKLPKNYFSTKESLIEYKALFNENNRQLNTCLKKKNGSPMIDYKNKHNHIEAVYSAFFVYCNYKSKMIIKEQKKVSSYIEFRYMESTYNGGKQYINEKIIGKPVQCYGYDFSCFYATMMGAEFSLLQMPIDEGKRIKLFELPKKLQLGIYHVRITSSNPDAKKVFAFNGDNYYTNYCIDFARKYQDELGFTIELIDNVKYNGYVYDKWVYTTSLFGDWFKRLNSVKKKYPKNKLLKALLSQLHGVLVAFKKLDLTEEMDDEVTPLDCIDYSQYKIVKTDAILNEDGELDLIEKVVNVEDPYSHSFARLKPFIVSYARCYIGKFIMKNDVLDITHRVHTDGIVFSEPRDFTHLPYFPIPEDKSSGFLTWYNVSYNNVSQAKLGSRRKANDISLEENIYME